MNSSLSFNSSRFVAQALTADESEGDPMEALERYSNALSTLTSGLAVIQRYGTEAGARIRDIVTKMERYSVVGRGVPISCGQVQLVSM